MSREFAFDEQVEVTEPGEYNGRSGRVVDWQQRRSDGGYTYIIEFEDDDGRGKFLERELAPL